jgi:hypothetical protein
MNANGCQSFLAVTDLQAVGALCGGRMRSRHVAALSAYSSQLDRRHGLSASQLVIVSPTHSPQSHCNPLAGGAGVPFEHSRIDTVSVFIACVINHNNFIPFINKQELVLITQCKIRVRNMPANQC